jgi:hypothetical protein
MPTRTNVPSKRPKLRRLRLPEGIQVRHSRRCLTRAGGACSCTPAVRGRRDRIAIPSEAATLGDTLPLSDRAIWATALYAGLRLGELQALDWTLHPYALLRLAIKGPASG